MSPTSDETADGTTGGVELEDGTYSLVRYSLDGGPLAEINESNRRDSFLMRLDSTTGVLQTAACVEPGSVTPNDSPCLISPSTTEWSCHCYGYAASDALLALEEFDEGTPPPTVELGAGAFEASLSPALDGFSLTPLPNGVWGSDGATSQYILESRSDTVFDKVFDDPDRPTCDPC